MDAAGLLRCQLLSLEGRLASVSTRTSDTLYAAYFKFRDQYQVYCYHGIVMPLADFMALPDITKVEALTVKPEYQMQFRYMLIEIAARGCLHSQTNVIAMISGSDRNLLRTWGRNLKHLTQLDQATIRWWGSRFYPDKYTKPDANTSDITVDAFNSATQLYISANKLTRVATTISDSNGVLSLETSADRTLMLGSDTDLYQACLQVLKSQPKLPDPTSVRLQTLAWYEVATAAVGAEIGNMNWLRLTQRTKHWPWIDARNVWIYPGVVRFGSACPLSLCFSPISDYYVFQGDRPGTWTNHDSEWNTWEPRLDDNLWFWLWATQQFKQTCRITQAIAACKLRTGVYVHGPVQSGAYQVTLKDNLLAQAWLGGHEGLWKLFANCYESTTGLYYSKFEVDINTPMCILRPKQEVDVETQLYVLIFSPLEPKTKAKLWSTVVEQFWPFQLDVNLGLSLFACQQPEFVAEIIKHIRARTLSLELASLVICYSSGCKLGSERNS